MKKGQAQASRSTPFAEFFRTASAEKKQAVFQVVLKRSTERQLQVMAKAS